MSTIIWQDGFEYTGGATLASVYGTGYVAGSVFATSGRNGGGAFNGIISVATGLSVGDAVVVGFARTGVQNQGHVDLFGPTGTLLATISIDAIADFEASFPTVGTSIGPTSTPGDRLLAGWRYIELQCVIAVSGRLIAAIDGRQIFDVSLNTGTQAIASVKLVSDNTFMDDWYVASPAATPDFKGDYSIAGTPPATVGSTPSLHDARITQQYMIGAYQPPLPNVAVTQQFTIGAYQPPKPNARVTQQYIIVAIKNKPGAKVRPQVVGVGRK